MMRLMPDRPGFKDESDGTEFLLSELQVFARYLKAESDGIIVLFLCNESGG